MEISSVLLVWTLDITAFFFSHMASVRSLPEATYKASGHVAQKEIMFFYHVPTVWLAVRTAGYMAAPNVDYSVWIITLLGGHLTLI